MLDNSKGRYVFFTNRVLSLLPNESTPSEGTANPRVSVVLVQRVTRRVVEVRMRIRSSNHIFFPHDCHLEFIA